MTETGTVIKVKNDIATVRVGRKSSCDKCRMCAFKPDAPHIDIALADTLNCNAGDKVEIEISGKSLLKITAVVYIIPLIMSLAGFITAYLLNMPETWQIALLVAGLGLGFVLVFMFDKLYIKKWRSQPKLIKKVEKNN